MPLMFSLRSLTDTWSEVIYEVSSDVNQFLSRHRVGRQRAFFKAGLFAL